MLILAAGPFQSKFAKPDESEVHEGVHEVKEEALRTSVKREADRDLADELKPAGLQDHVED